MHVAFATRRRLAITSVGLVTTRAGHSPRREGKQRPLQDRRHEGGLVQGEIHAAPSSVEAPVFACVFF